MYDTPRTRGLRWDTRVVFVAARRCWWWNAWEPDGCVERSGDATTEQEARDALAAATSPAGRRAGAR